VALVMRSSLQSSGVRTEATPHSVERRGRRPTSVTSSESSGEGRPKTSAMLRSAQSRRRHQAVEPLRGFFTCFVVPALRPRMIEDVERISELQTP
jgi:hypothetical protein